MEPMTTPSATLDTSCQPACLRITGDWTLAHYANLTVSYTHLTLPTTPYV